MFDREALAAALETWADPEALYDGGISSIAVEAAAQKWLAQIPETCGNVWHDDDWQDAQTVEPPDQCPSCHGTGKVYPPETVEAVAQVLCATHGGINYIGERDYQLAVAVLDALNGETP